jgi:YidC/Oxa1 family membrane protein insertase
MSPSAVVLANSLTHSVGQIFQPVFKLFAMILSAIYSVVPNYAVAIAVLTVIIMGALTPLTVKSTKSMLAMQRLQPEIKKLQQKYKGIENRQQLNEEMMRLYREEGVNPAGGCLPMFLQFPFLIILYDIVRGLTNTVSTKAVAAANLAQCHASGLVHGTASTYVSPRYIPHTSKMYCNLVTSGGQMKAFGIDLALKPFSPGLSAVGRIPFLVLIVLATGLQYLQMNQMNKRNAATQQNSSLMRVQKLMPILFAYIYFLIPAAVLIYMVVSSLIRIGTQEAIFRRLQPAGASSAPKVVPRNDADAERGLPAGKDGSGGAAPAAQSAPTPPPNRNPNTSKKKRKRKGR